MLVLGGATLAVSFVSMTVTRLVVEKQKKKYLITCRACSGVKKLDCDVCQGDRVLRYHPEAKAVPSARASQCACAMCEGTGQQVCLNCLGEGAVMPLAHGLQERISWGDDDPH